MHLRVSRFAVSLIGLAGVLASLTIVYAAAARPDFNSQTNLVQPSPFPQNKQNEPAIAQNPTDALNLIAGANDEIDLPACTASGCPFVANVGLSGVYVSHDGGASWTQFSAPAGGGGNTASFNGNGRTIHTLPGFGTLAAQLGIPGLASDGDPAIAFSRDGVAYYASLAGVRGTSAGDLLTVSRSTDKGTTWSDPVLATNQTNPVDFNDKEAIWVDKSPTSLFAGNIYVSWTLFIGAPGLAEPIVFSRSVDGGRTFAPAQRLSASFNSPALPGRQGSTIRTDPRGNVYVFWESAVPIQGRLSDAQVFAKSADGGVTFSQPAVVSPVVDLPSPLPGASFRNDSFPTVDIDQVSGTIYVAWADFRNGRGQVMLSTSSDGGASWSPARVVLDVANRSAFFPGIAVSPNGKKVTVATQAMDAVAAGTAPGAGVVSYDSYFAESVNGGGFSAPLKISTVSADPDGSSTNSLAAQFQGDYNTLISDNLHAWFIWTDARSAASCAAVDAFRAGTAPQPNEPSACPPNFGNTDILVARVGT
jgi:hypothetical protein